MLPMTQECVSESNEDKLNEEIDELLNGIDFQQSLSQPKSPTCIPSTFPEENTLKPVQEKSFVSQEESQIIIPSTFPEENESKKEYENEIDRDVEMSSPLLFATQDEKENEKCETVNSIPDSVVENLNIQEKVIIPDMCTENVNIDEGISLDEVEEGVFTVPVIQPFACLEQKSPVRFEDPMDTLEEVPITDIGDTYLTDEQFNEKYPKHEIDLPLMEQEQVMETVPHVLTLDDFGVFLDEQEKFEKLLGQNNIEENNFLDQLLEQDANQLVEERRENTPTSAAATAAAAASSGDGIQVKVEITAEDNSKVCLF